VNYANGCLLDQLIGQWWAHLLDLGYLFPQDRVAQGTQLQKRTEGEGRSDAVDSLGVLLQL
jgi:hypothetical protein